MKVLLSCIGTSDPYVDAEKKIKGPVLSLFDYIHRIDEYQDYKPDKIYLLATAKKAGSASYTEDRGIETRKILSDSYGFDVYTKLIDIVDPTEYSGLLPDMKNIIFRIMEELKGQDVEYLINVSPGLPQMLVCT